MVKKPKKAYWIIGIDEVGRGPLAGPVTVSAVALPVRFYKKMRFQKDVVPLNDSKLMTEKGREIWYREAKKLEKEGVLKIGIASRSASSIDTHGISICIKQCITSALMKLKIDSSDCGVLLDGGLRAPKEYLDQQTIIRGDQKYPIISLASVVAKVTRDRYMVRLHTKHPLYAWNKNKGYGTKVHITAVRNKGVSVFHRKTFLSSITQK